MRLSAPRRFRVAVTDGDWFRFLSAQSDLDEVDFWRPSGGRTFGALSPGEPLLFKLHAPDNFIVGGGFFHHYSVLPCSLAWEAFAEKNGAPDFKTMRRRVERYRRTQPTGEDYSIGCILLLAPFFWDRELWIPTPFWPMNTVQGKNFDTSEELGANLWAEVAQRLQSFDLGTEREVREEHQQPMFGDPVAVRPRLGQGTFRILVTDLYHRRCAISGEKALPALEAAHIRPVAEGGQHEATNGLLFRSDIHRLYDRGYVTVTRDYRFRVSRKLKDDFDNGEPYYPLAGQEIDKPGDSRLWPNRETLEWHADTVFRG